MQRMRLWGGLLVAPAVGAFLVLAGCSEAKKETPKGSTSTSTPSASKGGTESGARTASAGDKTPIEGKYDATLKGRVVYDGTPPAPGDLKPKMAGNGDKDYCEKGDTREQTWLIGANNGVENAIVFLRAPAGKFFKVPDNLKTRTDVVKMDQPFCAFVPHVAAINPTVYDPNTKKQVKTGQKFEILNSAPKNHNTKYAGDPLLNSGTNVILPGKAGDKVESLTVEAKPCKENQSGGEDLLTVNCNIHTWMDAKVGVFDHPFYAVTDKDGNYEIKNAPAGAEVIVCIWHESMNKDSLKGAKTETRTLKDGENKEDFKIK